MYQLVEGCTHDLADVDDFIARLNAIAQADSPELRALFDPAREIVVARAPGRVDVMGGIADYSGSLVLQLPIGHSVLVAAQPAADRTIRIVSQRTDPTHPQSTFEMPLDAFGTVERPMDYADAQARFDEDAETSWASYVAGVLLVLMRERSVAFPTGAGIFICSHVPEGKGVSSSGSLEVAVMQAVAAAFGLDLDPRELAILCQKVENLVVGAPCGVMDQMTAACGRANQLMALLCQPAELQGLVGIPEEIAFWGIDSGVRHFVSGADYGSVRIGAFMGYRMIAELAGLEATVGAKGTAVKVSDPIWNGYLANLTPSLFEQFFSGKLPEWIKGNEFLKRYSGTTDAVTHVQSDRIYAVRMPTAHPIYENFRVCSFAELLRSEPSEVKLRLLGELMYQSHASYSACGLGSDGTDLLVELVREAGAEAGLYGAKITGGGSGGTVAVMGRGDAGDAVRAVAAKYAAGNGHTPIIIEGSSPGAAAFGILRLKPC